MREITHFIDGAAVTGTSGRYGDVFNPNTGEVQARVQLATAAEVDLAVQSALKAQLGWAQVNPQRRARVMFEFKRLIERDMESLAELLSSEHGKVIGLLRRSIAYEWLKHRGLTCADKLSALPLAKPFLIPPETPVPDLVETLMRSAVSKALVVDPDQKLLGIVTLFDLLKGAR